MDMEKERKKEKEVEEVGKRIKLFFGG